MSAPRLRRLARRVGGLLGRVHPPERSGWVRAMRCEIEQVEDDRAALLFAAGCLWGGCREAAAQRIMSIRRGRFMKARFERLRQPQDAGIACALAATGLGLAYLAAAGAPGRYLVVNAAAFLLGVVALAGFAGAALRPGRFPSWAIAALGAGLLATAWFGASADGATRWIRVGPLGVQVSLIVLPVMILVFARRPDAAGATGMAIAAAALALQPDRAMAGVLAFAMVAVLAARPSRPAAGALAAALAGFAVALARPDALPAVPFVDRVLFTAFDVHPLAGAAVLLGAVLLLLPSLAGRRQGGDGRAVRLAFGAVWLGCILAAALGNYPTPVVGYGGSAILGYLISLAALPGGAGATAGSEPGAARAAPDRTGPLRKQASLVRA